MSGSGLASRIIALHGFLGLPSDWSYLTFGEFHAETPVAPHDLWKDLSELPRATDTTAGKPKDMYREWAERFTDRLRAEAAASVSSGRRSRDAKPVLLGYSMGGRLALHAALMAPELFSAVVLVSAHPGLRSEAEREARAKSDAAWAVRFQSEPWSAVVRAWNNQPVLQSPLGGHSHDTVTLTRREKDFSRTILARALEDWSLAKQADLRPAICECPLEMIFISGALDQKFTTLLGELNLHGHHRHVVVPGAGHRVPWDQPREFLRNLELR